MRATVAMGAVTVALGLACGGTGGGGDAECPDGIVRVDTWQGEYPGPVVNVTASTAVKAYTDPCAATATTSCTVATGLYHPWAPGSATYATVRAIDRYTASADFELEGTKIPAGSEVEVIAYMGEGFCAMRVDGVELGAMCPGMGEDPLVEVPRTTERPEDRQFFRTDCGWVEVTDALFATGTVREGTIVEYGAVGP